MDLNYVKTILASTADEGYPFKYIESGHHRHQEPKHGVILRLPHMGKSYYQMITLDNGFFEVKFQDDPGFKKGQLVELKNTKRVGHDKFRVSEWEFMEMPEQLGEEIPEELYRLTLKGTEQQTLEQHCVRFLTHFVKAGAPALGILPGPINGEVHCRHILLGPKADVVTALEKVDLPAQVDRGFQQITAEQLYEA